MSDDLKWRRVCGGRRFSLCTSEDPYCGMVEGRRVRECFFPMGRQLHITAIPTSDSTLAGIEQQKRRVDYLYRVADTAYGVRLFLTPERIEQLCKLCVLDPAGLDNVLLMAKRTSDYDRGGVFDYGTAGGFGRWLLLVRPCPVPTLPREPDL